MNIQSKSQNGLNRVMGKIQEIVEESENGDYIYRGESGCYGKVSSNLYREYEKEIEADSFDIKVVQQEILNEAKEYLGETSNDFEILTELQHLGGKTNLIDFTTDYLIALFFACDGSHDEPGRIILLENQSEVYEVIKPTKIINRVTSQKSIFVQPGTGFIDPTQYKVICIPEDLKIHVLDYLQKHHDISTKTIYNDLQGFIENRRIHRSDYTEFYKGMTCQNRGDVAENQVEKYNWYEKSVEHYSKVLELNPVFVFAYNNRGLAYHKKSEIDNAIKDFNRVIELAPYYTEGYANRGGAFTAKGEFGKAIADFKTVLALKNDYAEVYYNLGVTYEKKGEYDKAIENHNTAIELKPNFADVYYALGIVYREMGDCDQEFQNYTTAIELKPDFVEAFNDRGIIYALKGNHNKAIEDYTTTINLNQNHANAYFNRGISYGAKGDYSKAIQDYSYAIELKSGYTKAYCNRGEAWLHEKKWEKARADLTFAKDSGMDIVASFHNDYKSVEDFEQKNGVQLPEDIKAMLAQQ